MQVKGNTGNAMFLDVPKRSWFNSKDLRLPSFPDRPPYLNYSKDRGSLYIMDVKNMVKYENGVKSSIQHIGQVKIEILQLLEDACHYFWKTPRDIRLSCPIVSIAYAVTQGYLEGIWNDLLQTFCDAYLEKEWTPVNDSTRIRKFKLSFPPNYTGAIETYVIIDEEFVKHGTVYIARTVEPC